jgi:hypothetical protein
VSQDVIELLNKKHIKFHSLHKTNTVLDKEKIEFENGGKINYGLLIGIPPHKVLAVIRTQKLGENSRKRRQLI